MSRTNSQRYDAAVIGGGVVGVSAATYLAQAGLSVVLFDRARLAAGASGRNSGAIQHPFDRASADLYRDSLAQYRNLEADEDGFSLPAMPAGLLVIGTDQQAILRAASAMAAYAPELQPTFIAADDLVRQEPLLAEGVSACLLATGYPVAPTAATLAFARRAVRAGAVLREGERAVPLVVTGRVVGVRLDSGESVPCGSVLVAAGPWSHDLVPGWHHGRPIRPVWGVVVGTRLDSAPRRVLEEIGVEEHVQPPAAFSLVTAGGVTSVGSTFLPQEPEPQVLVPAIMARASEFIPALASVPIDSIRVCARPVAFDGRPLIGAVAGVEGLWVCAGHGPWGISTGPGSSHLVVRQMLGAAQERPEFSPTRFAASK